MFTEETSYKKPSVEELMKPRYKVIADWFDMLERFSVGYVFDHPYGRQYFTKESKHDPADFPHLFKRLEWWEYREQRDMPEYVKCIKTPDQIHFPDNVYKVTWLPFFGKDEKNDLIILPTNCYIPATKEDYINQTPIKCQTTISHKTPETIQDHLLRPKIRQLPGGR